MEIKKDLRGYCQDLFEEYRSSTYREKKMKEIDNARKRYAGTITPRADSWRSNKSMGLSGIAIDHLEPRLKSQLISADGDFVKVTPVNPEDVQQAKGVQDFLRWALKENVDIEKQCKPIVHNLLIDGVADIIPIWEEVEYISRMREMKAIWITPEGTRTEEVPEGVLPEQMGWQSAGITDEVTEKVSKKFKVKLELVEPTDAFLSDNGDWETLPYLRLLYIPYYDLKQMTPPYKNIKDNLISPIATDEDDPSAERKGIRRSEEADIVRLLECYVRWEGEWEIVTYALDSGWEEVRRQKLSEVYWHGRKPVRRLSIFKETNETYGTGIPQKIKYLDEGVDELFNLMIDCGTIDVLNRGFVTQGVGLVRADLELKPGKFITLPKDSKVQPIPPSNSSAIIMPFINMLLGFFERTVSLMDSTLPGNMGARGGKGTETYSGMALIVSEGNIKHQYLGESIRDQFSEVVKDILSLYAQYLPLDAKKRIFENNEWVFKNLDALAIQGEFDVSIDVSNSSANKMLHRRETVELYQMLSNNPLVNTTKPIADLLEAYGIEDTNSYIKPEFLLVSQAVTQIPQIVPMIQQAMQAKQQQDQQKSMDDEAKKSVEKGQMKATHQKTYENKTILEKAEQSAKRKLINPLVEKSVEWKARGAIGQGDIPRDSEEDISALPNSM